MTETDKAVAAIANNHNMQRLLTRKEEDVDV